MRQVLLKLAHRTIEQSVVKHWLGPERFAFTVDLTGAVFGPDAALEKLTIQSRNDMNWSRGRVSLVNMRVDWAFRAGRWKEEADRICAALDLACVLDNQPRPIFSTVHA
jgi:hypothetical protein